MSDETVFVVDELVVAPGQGEAILKEYLDAYGPGARARGFTLDRVLVNPPLWNDHAPNTITVSWTVQGAGPYWNTLFQSRNDEALAQWWKDFSKKLISRRRTVHAAAEDLKGSTMFKLTLALTFNEAAKTATRDAIAERLKAAAAQPGVGKHFISPTMPNVFFGGDVLAHYQFADEAALNKIAPQVDAAFAAGDVSNVDRVVYPGKASGVAKPDLKDGVYRTLLLSVDKSASPAAVEAFEEDLRSMTRHVPAIKNWQLSRTKSGSGAMPWTHVWEQEYESIDGLMGPYMMHPCHWGMVDRWFDPEFPEGMINPRICHTFVAAPASVLA